MAIKAAAKKGAVRTKRRERKNIERGAAHIQSTLTIPLLPLRILRATPFLGPALAV